MNISHTRANSDIAAKRDRVFAIEFRICIFGHMENMPVVIEQYVCQSYNSMKRYIISK